MYATSPERAEHSTTLTSRLANRVIADLRSDTVTRPCAGMRAAMAEAEVGDDVYGDDPTVNRLETMLADRLGKGAAVLFPTGTQSNLAAMLAHCGRGDEIITGEAYHVRRYEAGGASVLGGIVLHPLPVAADGALEPDAIAAAIKPDDAHFAVTRLLTLENTHYGRVVPLNRMSAAADAGRTNGLAVHLDGARFFNAVAALDCPPSALADVADTISVCLSKGLGCPAGSVLVGNSDVVACARRWRKMLGGGMRQAGVLAAAGVFALDRVVPTLGADHVRAERLAIALRARDIGKVSHATNMVFLTPRGADPNTIGRVAADLAAHGIVITAAAPTVRLVVHRDIDDAALDTAIDALCRVSWN